MARENEYVKLKNYGKKIIKPPFMIYEDFESILNIVLF